MSTLKVCEGVVYFMSIFSSLFVDPFNFVGVLEEAKFFGIESIIPELEGVINVCTFCTPMILFLGPPPAILNYVLFLFDRMMTVRVTIRL